MRVLVSSRAQGEPAVQNFTFSPGKPAGRWEPCRFSLGLTCVVSVIMAVLRRYCWRGMGGSTWVSRVARAALRHTTRLQVSQPYSEHLRHAPSTLGMLQASGAGGLTL